MDSPWTWTFKIWTRTCQYYIFFRLRVILHKERSSFHPILQFCDPFECVYSSTSFYRAVNMNKLN